MSGGAGRGDIASFATARSPAARAAASGPRCRTHRALGDGHDRLFGFESLEGSAFRDTLIGSAQANAIDGGPGDDHLIGGGGPRHDRRRPGHRRAARAPKGGPPPAAGNRRRKPPPTSSSNPTRAAAPGCRSSAAAAATSSSSPSTKRARPSASPRKRALAIGPGCSHPPGDRQAGHLPGRRPRPLADGRPRPRQRQPPGRRLAGVESAASASPAASATTRSKAAPRTT